MSFETRVFYENNYFIVKIGIKIIVDGVFSQGKQLLISSIMALIVLLVPFS